MVVVMMVMIVGGRLASEGLAKATSRNVAMGAMALRVMVFLHFDTHFALA